MHLAKLFVFVFRIVEMASSKCLGARYTSTSFNANVYEGSRDTPRNISKWNSVGFAEKIALLKYHIYRMILVTDDIQLNFRFDCDLTSYGDSRTTVPR